MSKYEILKQFRTPEEIHDDEQKEIHDNDHDPLCPDPRCWRCVAIIEAEEHLCRCGHDLDDEHRKITSKNLPNQYWLVCGPCGDRICEEVGEREAYEAKVEAINKAALPKVAAAVKEYQKHDEECLCVDCASFPGWSNG